MPELLRRQAQWLLEVNDLKAAEEMFWAAKDYERSIQILGDNQWLDALADKCRSLPKTERKPLTQAAAYFRAAGHHQYAKEVYLKLDDARALMKLHVELHKWDEAFALVAQNPDLQENIYAPYAEWLAINDRFDEAQVCVFGEFSWVGVYFPVNHLSCIIFPDFTMLFFPTAWLSILSQDAFRKAGRPDQSLRMLERLTHNAVTEHRYSDAAYYYWLLATETLKFVTAASPAQVTAADRRHLEKFHNYELKAELYYAYNIIYRYTEEPFVTSTPETIFNTSQFILNVIGGGGSAASNGGGGAGAGGANGAGGAGAGANAGGEEAPMGVSRVYTLVALAKQAKALGAFKLARKIYERLATLRVPPAWREQVSSRL
jgi:intraflagellar transport protein 122